MTQSSGILVKESRRELGFASKQGTNLHVRMSLSVKMSVTNLAKDSAPEKLSMCRGGSASWSTQGLGVSSGCQLISSVTTSSHTAWCLVSTFLFLTSASLFYVCWFLCFSDYKANTLSFFPRV